MFGRTNTWEYVVRLAASFHESFSCFNRFCSSHSENVHVWWPSWVSDSTRVDAGAARNTKGPYASFESWTCAAHVSACLLWSKLRVVCVLLAWCELKFVQYWACCRLRESWSWHCLCVCAFVSNGHFCGEFVVGGVFGGYLWSRVQSVWRCAVCVFAFSFSTEIATRWNTRASSKTAFFTIGNLQKQINATQYEEDSLTRKWVQKMCLTRSTMILSISSMCTHENDVSHLYFQARTYEHDFAHFEFEQRLFFGGTGMQII